MTHSFVDDSFRFVATVSLLSSLLKCLLSLSHKSQGFKRPFYDPFIELARYNMCWRVNEETRHSKEK